MYTLPYNSTGQIRRAVSCPPHTQDTHNVDKRHISTLKMGEEKKTKDRQEKKESGERIEPTSSPARGSNTRLFFIKKKSQHRKEQLRALIGIVVFWGPRFFFAHQRKRRQLISNVAYACTKASSFRLF